VLNPELLDLCTAWQTRSVDGVVTMNDHGDPGHDARVLDRLTDLDRHAEMTWIHPLAAENGESADVLGGKAHGLVVLRRLGLPVPPGFVIGAGACRAFLRDGRLPDGLDAELAAAVAELEAATGRPLAVSVRSGGRESMPGMMTTVLNLPVRQVEPAVAAVFSSWDTPRAQTYRELHGIPHHLGTAVTVQTMVFGNRDNHSGSGVAFSRNPNTGEHAPFGEVLFGRQGDDVVSGRGRHAGEP